MPLYHQKRKGIFWVYAAFFCCFLSHTNGLCEKFSYLSSKDRRELYAFVKKDLEKFYAKMRSEAKPIIKATYQKLKKKISALFEEYTEKRSEEDSGEEICFDYDPTHYSSDSKKSTHNSLNNAMIEDYNSLNNAMIEEKKEEETQTIKQKNSNIPAFIKGNSRNKKAQESEYICEKEYDQKTGKRTKISWRKRRPDEFEYTAAKKS